MKPSGGIDVFLFLVWCLILVGQGAGRSDLFIGTFPDGAPPSQHSPRIHPGGPPLLRPKFTPVAVTVPPIGTAPIGAVSLPGTPTFPTTPALPGAFGQTSGTFSPPPPGGLTVGPPQVLFIPSLTLGQGSGAFSPSQPQIQLIPLAGNAPQASPGAGIPFFVPFVQGPTAIINQFVQPPLVPFGQVGVPVQSYLPGFFTGNANPFNRSCNYYYFQGCGPSGGAVTDFNFSTR